MWRQDGRPYKGRPFLSGRTISTRLTCPGLFRCPIHLWMGEIYGLSFPKSEDLGHPLNRPHRNTRAKIYKRSPFSPPSTPVQGGEDRG